MPELPEVETTRRALAGTLTGQRIQALVVRERRLRQPIPRDLAKRLKGAFITGLERRSKYLLLNTDAGTALMHLGMSGSLRITEPAATPGPHDHYDLVLANGHCLRYRDPRRFGLLLWAGTEPSQHPLLRHIGPEPFDAGFDGDYLYTLSRGRRVPIKGFLMDGRIVAGVGNIYANEALYRAGIHPHRPAGRIGATRYALLAREVKTVLREAIEVGGTTLRDFFYGTGESGYFRIKLAVYDQTGQPCRNCGTPIRRTVIGQRASYFCPRCQR